MLRYALLVALLGSFVAKTQAECLANSTLDMMFADAIDAESIPTPGSCCQADVCGLGCPEEVTTPSVGFGVAVGLAIFVSFFIGLATYFCVKGEAENYFVAGKSLPLWIVAMTLGAQSVDSNALLGNVDLSYKYHFYDGAVIPIGLGLSLLLNGIFLAANINNETNTLTLPDVFAKRYGKTVEVLVSLCAITSFLMLLAGNLVGMGVITSYVWGITETGGIWLATGIVWAYTVSGGLFSVAYTDVVQGAVGWTGCIVCAYWFIANAEEEAPPPSLGFPNYVYPDAERCQMYNGTACDSRPESCCYNMEMWCVNASDTSTCQVDNGAYPIGDQRVFSDQMTNAVALTPFPNAIFWNWATIFILAFGNLGALDFQVRCMAAKTPKTAKFGCIIGGLFTFFVGIPFAYLGAITRYYYGPDSPYAEFEADTCSTILGLPTCAAWVPDQNAFLHLLTHQAPPVVGAWCLIGIVAASMSTADGAILAMGTVFAHNVMRQFDSCFPNLVTPENLLLVARLTTIPFTIISACIGSFYRSSDSAAGATGYLLIVAFDIVLATLVAPLFGAFYAKKPSPRAAFCAIMVGLILRITLEFVLPKDGLLLLPYDDPEFYNYGAGASFGYPTFIYDADMAELWNFTEEQCQQTQFEDYTGVDSLSAFVGAILTFITVQFLEHRRGGKPLFTLPGMVPYEKQLSASPDLEDKPDEKTAHFSVSMKLDKPEKTTEDDEPADKTASEDKDSGEEPEDSGHPVHTE